MMTFAMSGPNVRTCVLTGASASVATALPERGAIVVGRRGGDADLAFDDPSLSRRHARLATSNGAVTIVDLGSKNGTRVGGRLLRANEPCELPLGAVAELGGVMLTVVERAPGRRARKEPRKADTQHDLVVTPSLEPLVDLVSRVGPTDLPVLLLGETGVGKDVFAERVHLASKRAGKPFVRINAAALAEQLFESELFGHEQGAFTGALRGRAGLLESADGGTVFIDEVGELSPSMQVKLLRVIDDRRVQRVGGTTTKRVDVRFVTATNRDLAKEVKRGAFRKDLYHRLRGVVLEVPALRERRADIPLLATAFLARVAPDKRFGDDALRALAKSPFFGNVRELRNVVERTALLSRTARIGGAALVWDDGPAAPSDEEDGKGSAGAAEARRIAAALARAKGNQTEAAKLLGISRRSLVYKLTALDMPRPRKPRA